MRVIICPGTVAHDRFKISYLLHTLNWRLLSKTYGAAVSINMPGAVNHVKNASKQYVFQPSAPLPHAYTARAQFWEIFMRRSLISLCRQKSVPERPDIFLTLWSIQFNLFGCMVLDEYTLRSLQNFSMMRGSLDVDDTYMKLKTFEIKVLLVCRLFSVSKSLSYKSFVLLLLLSRHVHLFWVSLVL